MQTVRLIQPDSKYAVNSWIEQKQQDGTIEKLYNYWILGRQAKARAPHWVE